MAEQRVLSVVESFLDAVEARDFDGAEAYLSPQRFLYLGPTIRFERAADFMTDLRRVDQIMKRIERRKVFVDGQDVLVVFDFLTTVTELERTRVAEWFTLEEGRIIRIEVFFDAYPYNKMFEV